MLEQGACGLTSTTQVPTQNATDYGGHRFFAKRQRLSLQRIQARAKTRLCTVTTYSMTRPTANSLPTNRKAVPHQQSRTYLVAAGRRTTSGCSRAVQPPSQRRIAHRSKGDVVGEQGRESTATQGTDTTRPALATQYACAVARQLTTDSKPDQTTSPRTPPLHT